MTKTAGATDPATTSPPRFVVAIPYRSVCDDQARVLARHGLLCLYALRAGRGVGGTTNSVRGGTRSRSVSWDDTVIAAQQSVDYHRADMITVSKAFDNPCRNLISVFSVGMSGRALESQWTSLWQGIPNLAEALQNQDPARPAT